jgi:hypothetical protein
MMNTWPRIVSLSRKDFGVFEQATCRDVHLERITGQRRPSASASDGTPHQIAADGLAPLAPQHWYSRLSERMVRLALTGSASESHAKLTG